MITIQNQNFGVEIELTGITRQAAAQVIADYYGTIGTRFMGTAYKTYEAVDNKGRRWKCMRDASITPQRRVNGHVVDANDEYKCEVVTPILQYEDIQDLQSVLFEVIQPQTVGGFFVLLNDAALLAIFFDFGLPRKLLRGLLGELVFFGAFAVDSDAVAALRVPVGVFSGISRSFGDSRP